VTSPVINWGFFLNTYKHPAPPCPYVSMNTLFTFINRRKETIREALFPLGCALCGKALNQKSYEKPFEKQRELSPFYNRNSYAFYGLCTSCLKSLTIPTAERGRCSCCGQPLVSEITTCLPCRNGTARAFDRIIPLFPYMGKYQKVLAAYKFGRRLSLGNFFVEMLRQGLEILQDSLPDEFSWVPVPAKPGKIKHKGWDQIEYLAKLMEAGINGKLITVERCLKRLPSQSQKELDRKNRLENLKDKIIIDKTGEAPKTAVLFDDVYTTGATMDACAAALKSAGTERVYGICLCYD